MCQGRLIIKSLFGHIIFGGDPYHLDAVQVSPFSQRLPHGKVTRLLHGCNHDSNADVCPMRAGGK